MQGLFLTMRMTHLVLHKHCTGLRIEDRDGIEVLKILKKTDPHLAVIMMNGHGRRKPPSKMMKGY